MKTPTILELLQSDNAAELLKKEDLKKIGSDVCERYGEDKASMSEWESCLHEGFKLCEPAKGSRSEPFEGASNYKSNIIDQAVIEFGDRAKTEILGQADLVGVKKNIEQDDEQFTARVNRVTKYMNWQFNTEQRGYRKQTEGMFYELARVGVVFRKTFYDSEKGCNRSSLIRYPNFAVNNDTPNGDELPCFTELKDYSDSEVAAKQNLGVWLDTELTDDEEVKDIQEPDDTLQDDDGKDGETEEESCKFLEQYTWLDLDDDGIYEPYVVTVHRPSAKVLRIVARFDLSGVKVKAGPGIVADFEEYYAQIQQELLTEKAKELMSDPEAQSDMVAMFEENGLEEVIESVNSETLSRIEIINIEPLDVITKYGFINNPTGDYLDYGFCHILVSLVQLINTTTNQTVDAATLQNLGGGFKSKEFRNTRSNMKFKPGEYKQTDVSASVLANGIKSLEFKGPSNYLVQFSDKVKQEAIQTAQRVVLEETLSPNAPAATTLGLLAEKMVPTTARFQGILNAMSCEFRIMYRLNGIYTDPQTYAQVTDTPPTPGLFEQDFETRSYDMEVKAAGNAMSRVIKMQRNSALLSLSEGIIGAGGDMRPIYEEVFDNMDASNLFKRVFPNKDEMSPQQQQALQQQLQLQQQQLREQKFANELNEAHVEEQRIKNRLKQQELDIKATNHQTEAQLKQVKLQQEQQKLDREDRKMLAEMQFKAAELQRAMFETEIDAEATLAQAEKYLAEAGKTIAETESEVVKARMVEVQSMLNDVIETVRTFE